MTCAPSSSRMSCGTPLTDPTVPTGINTGVSISACGVTSRPVRACAATSVIWNVMDTSTNCSVAADASSAPSEASGGSVVARVSRIGYTLCRSSVRNLNDLSTNPIPVQHQPADRNRQLEPPRPRAARIEIEHAIPHLLLRNMAVPKDDRIESRSMRLQIESRQIVQDIDGL